MTRAYRRYLSDYRQALLRDHLQRFVDGAAPGAKIEEIDQLRTAFIQELLLFGFPAIRDFYGEVAPPPPVAQSDPFIIETLADLPQTAEAIINGNPNERTPAKDKDR